MKRDIHTGRTLAGDYRLGPLVGSDKRARLYRARQLRLDREVTLELFEPDDRDASETVAFWKEACAAGRLRHPGIAMVLDSGQDPEGLLYLVSEPLAGRDLVQLARREAPLRAQRIASLMGQVALALAHAHERGVVSRALSPERVWVLRALAGDGRPYQECVKIVWTATSFLHGEPACLSPEQASGGVACPQSDLYACGVILYLLATGRLPFSTEAPLEVAQMHISRPVPKPSEYHPGIDRTLEQIILCCLEKRPAARPASARALSQMLRAIPETRGPAARQTRATRGQDRHAKQLWFIAIASAVVAFVWASFFWEKWTQVQSTPRVAPAATMAQRTLDARHPPEPRLLENSPEPRLLENSPEPRLLENRADAISSSAEAQADSPSTQKPQPEPESPSRKAQLRPGSLSPQPEPQPESRSPQPEPQPGPLSSPSRPQLAPTPTAPGRDHAHTRSSVDPDTLLQSTNALPASPATSVLTEVENVQLSSDRRLP